MFLITTKSKVYQSREQSDMLYYGNDTWCLNDKEAAVLRRTERALLRAMRGLKLMAMLGLTVSMEMEAKANALRWFGHEINLV